MKVTIVQGDSLVGIDGDFRHVDLSELPAEIRAIQFDTDQGTGHVEYDAIDTAGNRPPNENIGSLAPYQLFLERWANADPTNAETPEPVTRTRFTSLEFLERFTEAEQLVVVSATMQSPAVKLWYDKMLAAVYIDLADARTIAGIDALISAGLIDESRREALVSPEAP